MNYFACAADGYSSDTYEMGEALFASFCRHETKHGELPLDYGSILCSTACVSKPRTNRVQQVWDLINGIVRRLAKNSGVVRLPVSS